MIKSINGKLLNTNEFISSDINTSASNSTIDYLMPIFKSSVIYENKPAILFTGYNQFITLSLNLPRNLENYNYLSITPYIFQYEGNVVFASIDNTISLFDYNLHKGKGINFVFTFSENIANYYKSKNYIVSRIPSDYSLSDFTFLFLFRLGTISTSPKKKLGRAVVKLNTMYNFNLGRLFTSNSILLESKKPQLESYLYYSDLNYLNYLLKLYYATVNKFVQNTTYKQLTTYPYLANATKASTATTSFYETIQYSPPLNLQGNNTEENYFNTNPIRLLPYVNTGKYNYIIIISVNQCAFGYGLTSNIQIYNTATLNLIENGSYNTSPDIPLIGSYQYPRTNMFNNTYPLISIQVYSMLDIINSGVTEIIISERISYNPINFNSTKYSSIPKFSVFLSAGSL